MDIILVRGDVDYTSYETGNFKECINLEKWLQEVQSNWKRNNKDITLICPRLNFVMENNQDKI